MIRRSTAARGLALAAVLGVGLAACSTTTESGGSDGGRSQDPLIVGTILPVTGTLSSLGPPEIAGTGLAIADINEAGGVLGNDVTMEPGDSGDTTDPSVAQQTATDLISKGAQVVIGAASSGVSLNVVDQFTEAGVMQISPANTATDLSGASDFFARTAPPDTVQGAALGSLILDAGHQKVAMIVQDEAYGNGLRDNIQQAVEEGGAQVVYGATDAGDEFPPGESSFSGIVTQALAAKPDAIVVLAFEETQAIVSELLAQKWDFNGTTYFSDGNTQTYEEAFEPGTLEGVTGTIPGAQAPDEFRTRVTTWYEENEDDELADFSYAPESYDAVVLAALAAVRGEGTDGATISENIQAVSGAEGGTEVTTFADGVKALEAGDEIHYKGQSGVGPLNEANDPSSALIGVYKYDKNNANVYETAIEGKVPQE